MTAYRSPRPLAKLAPRASLWRRARFVARMVWRDFARGVVEGYLGAALRLLDSLTWWTR